MSKFQISISRNRNHTIDFVFPLILLLIFALSAVSVTVFGAMVYKDTVTTSDSNNAANTSLSYISEKIHSTGNEGTISVGDFNGQDALLIHSEIDNVDYITYIYFNDNHLYELTTKQSLLETAQFSLNSGTAIIEIEDFVMEQISNDLLRFSCKDSSGKTQTSIVMIRTD